MRVKRLEIQGFKSFKDKTVVHFDDGVTGIVGPNGCGKSNIVDSFFWVMGEQSNKHMRAQEAKDLIFNGSEKYSPSGFAEVTMVLATGASQNTLPEGVSLRDLPPHMRYSEISVTRRLYRDGNSEYLINGQLSRLKDIHELFMDTGAGPKAYSIIEQGQISKIVASKPEDRRVLVEEAAGIVKFKARKKESQRKIEATRANLLRINDIITEIERQLAFLEKQAARARQFKEFKTELTEKETFVGRKKLFSLKQKADDLKIRLSEATEHDTNYRTQISTLELEVETLKIQLTEAASDVDSAQNQLQIVQRAINQEDTKIQLQKRKIQEVENLNLTVEEEEASLFQQRERIEAQRSEFEQDITAIETLFRTADDTLKQKQNELDVASKRAAELGSSVDQMKREVLASLTLRSDMSNQVFSLEAKVDSLSVQANLLSSKISDHEIDVEVWQNKELSARELFEEAQSNAIELKSQVEASTVEHNQLDVRVQALRSDERITAEQLTKDESKLAALTELLENREGFQADVQAILKDPAFQSQLRGVLADVLEIKPGYELALEAALRDFLETLFIDDVPSAKNLLNELKNQASGRATFWAYDVLQRRANALENIDVGVSGAVSLASLLTIDSPQSGAIISLFNNIFVCDNFDDAFTLFNNLTQSGAARAFHSIVTRDGDLIDSFGRISGGSAQALAGGVVSRRAECAKLQESVVSLREHLVSIRSALVADEDSLQKIKQTLNSQTHELRELEFAVKSSERDLSAAIERLSVVQRELTQERQQREQFEADRQELWLKLDAIRSELSGIESDSREKELEIDQKSSEWRAAQELQSEIQGAMVQLKVDFAQAQEKYRAAKLGLERIKAEQSRIELRANELLSLRSRRVDEKDILLEELHELETRFIEMQEQVLELESSARQKKNDYEILNQQLNSRFQQQREALKRLEEAATDLNRIQVETEKVGVEFQMLSQALFEKYGIDESNIEPKSPEERERFDALSPEREAALFADVDRLREKIRRLGEVNLMAVEEYDSQKKRHEFLLTQRDDLNRSITDLERAIERINKTSESRFKLAFEEINSRFQRIFPIIFGGGWGKLTMTNPDDLNETGIEIIAEPPGKKVGSIQLMSGGEKALTAVALIFSIFLIKPSPFCVLDEVDAPLDDHNVGKFNALLKEMAQRSQFIIITHNKRTMELNDKLYGVTMEEPGVSKMVSIQIH